MAPTIIQLPPFPDGPLTDERRDAVLVDVLAHVAALHEHAERQTAALEGIALALGSVAELTDRLAGGGGMSLLGLFGGGGR